MNPRIRKYLALYSSPAWRPWIARVLARSRPFAAYIRSRIAHYHLPRELLYLPIAESSYDPYAVSKVGAAGLWQLMSKTGRLEKLKINGWEDQRFDFWNATDASLKTLRTDDRALGSWMLALAAYDAGLGFMESVIARTGIHNYWKLSRLGYLPPETTNYVPRFFALVALFSYPGRYGIALNWEKPVEWVRIALKRPVNIRLLADEAHIDRTLLLEGNAGLRYRVTPPGSDSYTLNVPRRDAAAVKRVLEEPQSSLMSFYLYGVKRGDTLFRLSKYYGVPIAMILRYNPGVTAKHMPAGTLLLIPAVRTLRPYGHAGAPKLPPKLAERFSGSYTVKKGDTLWSISRRFHTDPSELAQINGIGNESVIRAGRVLRVPPA